MSTEAQLKALSNSELASGTQIPALKHRTVNNAIIEEMYDAQSRGNVLSGVQSATSLASGDEVFVIRSGEAYLLDADELGFVSTLADLTDVNIPAPSNDQVLAYNFGTSKWMSKDVSSLSSVVSITGTATTNQMVKFTGLSSIGNSNISDDGSTVAITGNLSVNTDDLYVNSSNNRVGVGTSTPATSFQVVGNILADFVATSGNSFTKIFSMDQDIQTTDAVEFAGVTAGSFVTSGGTSTDFVKGDGSLDGTTYQDEAEKNQANGYAPLDSGAKIPLANLPDSILGQVSYQGTWAASTNTPTLANPPASTTKGEYYVASDDGTQFGIEFKTGDWIISNGTAWEKVDNTDAVTSVFGRLGNVLALQEDYDGFYVTLDTFQQISGRKNFDGGINSESVVIQSAGSTNSQTEIANIVGNFLSATGTNGIGFNEDNNIYFTKDNSFGGKGGVLAWNNTINRTYTLPDASGTFAFTNVNNNFSVGQSITSSSSSGVVALMNNTDATNGFGLKITAGGSAVDRYALHILDPTDTTSYFKIATETGKVGYVGISEPNPTEKLDVNGNVKATSFIGSGASLTGVAKPDVNNNFSVGQTINGNTTINGNVGIGTSSPDAKLEVNGNIYTTSNTNFLLLGTNPAVNPYIQGDVNNGLFFGTDNSSRLSITSTGNVGIGTTSPSEKLDVAGNVTISGSLSKGSGSFKIDHPLPEKKDTHHLVHSFVEAPQADNIYRGKINLVDGKATVNLDEAGRMTEGTFVLLNGNIQCFTSNESGWTAIRGKVEGNILTIEAQDAKCTDTISWLVIGERIDQHMIDTSWTDENGRVITEPLKKVEPTPNEEITE